MAIIAVANQKGGVTKSTTARNLAIGMDADLLIDQDKNQNNIRWFKGLRSLPTTTKVAAALGSQKELDKLLDHDGLIIVDCSGADTNLSRTVLAYADLIICPCSNDYDSISTTQLFSDTIKQIEQSVDIKLNLKLLRVLEMPQRKNYDFIDELLEYTQWQAFKTSRPARKCYKTASNLGLGISEYKNAPIAAKNEFKSLIEEIKLEIN